MSAKKVIIWLLFLALAAALYFLSEAVDRRSQEHEREANRLVSLSDPLRVQSISLGGAEVPKAITIERRDKEHRWVLTKPLAYPADGMQVAQLLSTVLESQSSSRISEPGDLKQFGLDPPAFQLTLTDRKGGKADLLVGNLSPTKEFAYAAKPGAKEVWLASPLVRGALNRTLFELRDKAVLDFMVNRVDGLELTQGGRALTLQRVRGGAKPLWRFADGGEADPSAVEDLLYMVHGLMAVDFLDQGIDPRKMGLSEPTGKVILSLEGGGKKGLVIGGPVTGREERYLRRLAGGPVMVVKQSSLDRLKEMNRFKLGQRRLLRIEREDVVALSVERGGVTLQYAKQGGKWTRTQPPGDEKSGEAAGLLVWDLVNLKWQKLLGSAGPAGLDKPSAVIKLTLKPPASKQGQAATVEVKQLVLGQVDAKSGLLGAQLKGDARIFALSPEVLSNLPAPPAQDKQAPRGPK